MFTSTRRPVPAPSWVDHSDALRQVSRKISHRPSDLRTFSARGLSRSHFSLGGSSRSLPKPQQRTSGAHGRMNFPIILATVRKPPPATIPAVSARSVYRR